MNEYEELIEPKEMAQKQKLIDRIRIGAAKIIRGSESHPRTTRDGSLSYVDSHGRLIVEKNLEESHEYGGKQAFAVDSSGNIKAVNDVTRGKHMTRTLKEIYPGVTKGSEPAIEEVVREIGDFSKGGKSFTSREKHSFFASKKDYDKWQEWLNGNDSLDTAEMHYQDEVSPGRGAYVEADILYDKDGGYEMDLKDNTRKTYMIEPQSNHLGEDSIQVDGTLKSHIVKEKYLNYYRTSTDTKFISEEGQNVGELYSKTYIEPRDGRIVGEELKYIGSDNNSLEYHQMNLNGHAKGKYLSLNERIKMATGCHQAIFEKDDDGVKMRPQKSFEDLYSEYSNSCIDIKKGQEPPIEISRLMNIFKLEIDSKTQNIPVITMLSQDGRGTYARFEREEERLAQVYNEIKRAVGNIRKMAIAGWTSISSYDKETPRLADYDFLNSFTGRASKEEIDGMDLERLEQKANLYINSHNLEQEKIRDNNIVRSNKKIIDGRGESR